MATTNSTSQTASPNRSRIYPANSLRFSLLSALLVVSTAVVLSSCGSKKKAGEEQNPAAAAGNPDATVSNQPLSLEAQGSDSGKIEGLNSVYFDYDKSSLSAETRKILADNVKWIKAHPDTSVQIEGHTDARGSVEYNLALGERRAKSVKQYMISLGVSPKSLTTISYGKEKLLMQGDSEDVHAKNRRANFLPLSK